MITLHESNITSFPHDNGIGVLKDVIRAYAEEELNGLFEFYMEYDSEGHLVDELKEERIIKAKAQDKLGYQLFRIYSITKNHENDNLIIRAQHITYDLADNFVEKLEANNLTKKQVMELIGSSTVLPHPFNVTSTNTTTRSSTRLYRTNPLQMIGGMEGSILQIWGGQIERDNFNLILHDRRGSDDGVKVTYEKNITGLEATFDISNLVTRIFPFVYIEETDNEPARLITVSGKYIDSPHINDYEKIYIKPIDYSNDERIDIQDKTDAQIRQQLTNIASKYFEETGNDKIKVDMEVQFEHLWETEEYKDLAVLELVGMGDTVTIEHSRLKVNATAIVNYIRYDCIAEKNEEVRLGSVKARLTDNVNKTLDVVEKVEQAQQTANQAIRAANGKNTIYYGPDEPEGGIEGDLWFRVVDGEYTRTYRHDGIQWQLVLSVDVRDAINEAQQAKDEAQQAVERANQATQQVTNAINQAQTAFDEAQAALSTANNALTQATSAFSLANDAFSEVESLSTLVDENTGEISTIKQSVIGLQTQVSDNAGNISSLTQIAQGLQTQVTDIEGNVSTLQQTAQGLQSSVTNLQNELDGLEIGGRNLFSLTQYQAAEKETGPGDTIGYVFQGEPHTSYILSTDIPRRENLYDVFFDIYPNQPSSLVNGVAVGEPRIITTDDTGKMVIWLRKTNGVTEKDVLSGDYHIKLEKGNKATDWTPAPEDIEHQFSTIAQTIDSITTRVGDAEGNITALQQTSSSLAARLTSAEGNITTLTATVNGLQTTVSNIEGDVSSVTQLANALQVRMTNAEGNISTLTQTASSLQSTVSSLRFDFDNLEIGGRNLIRNGDFSDGNKYWIGNFTRVVKDGKNAIEMVGNDGNNLVGSGENAYFLLEPNTIYTYQVEIMVDTQIEVSNSQPLHYHIRADGANQGGREWIVLKSSSVLTPNKWHKIILQFKTKDITSPITFRPYIYQMPAGVKFWITYFKLELGNKATDWTPAPEDMATQSQITQLSDAINLRVQKGDVLSQINIEAGRTLIDTDKLVLSANTTHITGDFKIDGSAHIKDASIGNAQIGYIDAAKIATGTLQSIDIFGVTIRGSTIWVDGDRPDFLYTNAIDTNPNTAGKHIYIRPTTDGEVRATVTNTIDQYVPMRADSFKAAPLQDAYITTDKMLRVTSHDKSTYRDIRGNVIYGAGFTTTTTNAYIGTDNELRVVNKGYVQGSAGDPIYRDIRANDIYNRAMITTTTHAYIGTDDELRVVNKGLTGIYRDVRALGFIGNRVGLGTHIDGSHFYVQPALNGEVRITDRSGNGTYRPIRASSFNEASSRDYKTNIEKFNESALDVINDLTVVTYNLINDLENGILEKKIGFISEDSPAIATADGKAIQTYQLSAYNTKAIQELDLKFTNLEDEVNWLKLENQYLKQKIQQLEEMIA